MRWNKKTDLAIRMLVALSEHPKVIPSAELAHAIGATQQSIIQIASPMQAAGLIETVAGPYGGFCLAKGPSEISLYQVIVSVELPHLFYDGNAHEGKETSIIDDVLDTFQELADSIFKNIYISEVSKSDNAVLSKSKKKSLNEMVSIISQRQASQNKPASNKRGA